SWRVAMPRPGLPTVSPAIFVPSLYSSEPRTANPTLSLSTSTHIPKKTEHWTHYRSIGYGTVRNATAWEFFSAPPPKLLLIPLARGMHQRTYQLILGMLAYHEAARKQGASYALESTNHASIVSIYGGNAETDSLASVVGQFVDGDLPKTTSSRNSSPTALR